jgi:hypothetical protein
VAQATGQIWFHGVAWRCMRAGALEHDTVLENPVLLVGPLHAQKMSVHQVITKVAALIRNSMAGLVKSSSADCISTTCKLISKPRLHHAHLGTASRARSWCRRASATTSQVSTDLQVAWQNGRST